MRHVSRSGERRKFHIWANHIVCVTSYGTHMDEACETYEKNQPCPTYERFVSCISFQTHKWVMCHLSHTWVMSHIWLRNNRPCPTYEDIVSYILFHPHEWVMCHLSHTWVVARVWMRKNRPCPIFEGIAVSDTFHTYKRVMSPIWTFSRAHPKQKVRDWADQERSEALLELLPNIEKVRVCIHVHSCLYIYLWEGDSQSPFLYVEPSFGGHSSC